MLLDYRCHVKGERIHKSFWPQLNQCLQNIGRMTPQQVFDKYGYPEMTIAAAVQQRAKGGWCSWPRAGAAGAPAHS